MTIEALGWDEFFNTYFEPYKQEGYQPARVTQEHKNSYVVYTNEGEFIARISGKMRYTTRNYSDFPAVGDWVVVKAYPQEEKATIHAILPRKNKFSRKAVLSGGMPDTGGKTEEQVLAANIDSVFLVSGMDGNFNLRRIERYMTAAYDSGTNPVIVMNKIDLCDDIQSRIAEVEAITFDTPILPVSALKNNGIDQLGPYLIGGKTVVFLGSSGVGKSSLINRLLGIERLRVNSLRKNDHRGRHTTTTRELIVLENGGVIIDTPGLREFQPWKGEEDLIAAFEDIAVLAEQCRFRDCRHENEPDCAVHRALSEGLLNHKRFENYLQMIKEARFLEIRQNQNAQQAEKTRWKQISKWQKRRKEII